MSSPLVVDCPGCGRRAEFSPANPWRPFCSQRCKTGDLGAWASGQYVISGEPLDDTSSDGHAGVDARPGGDYPGSGSRGPGSGGSTQ